MKAYDLAVAVVVGRVRSITVESRAVLGNAHREGYQRARVEVIQSLKGPYRPAAEFGVITSMEYTMCGMPVSVGQELLIYAYGAEPHLLERCGRTTSLKYAAFDLEVLGRVSGRGSPPAAGPASRRATPAPRP